MTLSTKKPCYVEMNRDFVRVHGEDATSFLQGLITNDITRVTESDSIYAALLTPQGRYLHDFLVHQWEGGYLLEGEKGRMADLKKRLGLYKLRANVKLETMSDLHVYCIFNVIQQPSFDGVLVVRDPRLKEAGVRVISARPMTKEFDDAEILPLSSDDFEEYRLALGLPDGERDMVLEKGVLLECGFDELKGIDFDKGCYLGQELNVRTKFRGKVRKRLLPLVLRQGHMPEYGSEITMADKKIGTLRTARLHNALGMVRIEGLTKVDFPVEVKVGDAVMELRCPDWVKL